MRLALMSLMIPLVASCDKDVEAVSCAPVFGLVDFCDLAECAGSHHCDLEPGSILGRVCDPSGQHWLPDAMVYSHLTDDSGKRYDTRVSYTDRDGYFLLDPMPAGKVHTIYVQYDEVVFETYEAEVQESEDVVLDEPDCAARGGGDTAER